ncbi:acid protease [Acephala macrosclerotiorum]|nr:acid protease [Acephala macrosclerotiorum]
MRFAKKVLGALIAIILIAVMAIAVVLYILSVRLDVFFLILVLGFRELRWRAAQASQEPRCATLPPTLPTHDLASWKISTHGSIPFNLMVDTGSTLLWVAGVDFPCRDLATDNLKPSPQCSISTGPRYIVSSTFVHSPGTTFSHTYTRRHIEGRIGCEVVTIGDLTIKSQEIGVATTGIFGVSGEFFTSAGVSGILGLAYRGGLSTASDGRFVDPLFTNLYTQSPMSFFSLIIERLPVNNTSGSGGYLGLERIPDVQHKDKWAVAPIITKGLTDHLLEFFFRQPSLQHYRIGIGGLAYGKGDSKDICHVKNAARTRFQAVVDSGSNYNFLPLPVTKSILAL